MERKSYNLRRENNYRSLEVKDLEEVIVITVIVIVVIGSKGQTKDL